MTGSRLAARIAWVLPAVLLALSLHQVDVARDLAHTVQTGELVWADVTRYDRTDRKDVTNVEIDLAVHLPDGSVLERSRLTLPYSIGHRIEEDSIQVHVAPGADQEVVIASIAGTHTSIAWSNAAMSFVAFLLALAGVVAWNRYLRRSDGITEPSA